MKLLRVLLYLIFIVLLTRAIYVGVTTRPTEVDSLSYHIPMAERVLNGTITNPLSFDFPNPTYPGSTEVLLSIFVLLGIPLNLFNVVAWVCLAAMAYLVARRCGLSHTVSLLCSASISLLPSVVRLLPTQTADLWLDVFFMWMIYLLIKPEKTIRYFLYLGVAAGMVVGAKFSGPLFVIATFLVLGKKVLNKISITRLLVFIIPFLVLGGSWYIRNWVYFGNPLYPSPLLFFQGVKNFSRYMQPHWHTMFIYPGGFLQTINAWLSEYLIWIVAPVICSVIAIQTKDAKVRALCILGFVSLVIYMIIPGYPFNYSNIVSEVRYGHPAVIVWIIAIYVYFQSHKLLFYLIPVLVMNMMVFFLPFPYRPKLYIFIELVIMIIAYFLRNYLNPSPLQGEGRPPLSPP